MNYLLDTSVLSEWIKPRPDPGVTEWVKKTDEDRIFLSVVTLAELRHGIERLEPGKRRNRLDEWLKNELATRFEHRILPIDTGVADVWGKIVAHCERTGRSIRAMDALIAATAERYELTLVTRNTGDFMNSLKAILNPWTN